MVPWPGRLSTLEPAAHGGDQRARLERADAEAAGLGRGEGLEQAVADEVAVHADALVGDRDRDARRRCGRRGRSPAGVGELASTAFWSEWPTACSSAAASTTAHRPASPSSCTSWSPRLAAIAAVRIGAQRLRLDPLDAAPARAATSRASRSFILPTELLQRRDHVGAELGIVGVPLGIARDQRQLADQVLDVVQDEGEAAVEFLEPLGVGQRLLAVRLGERARRLAAGGAQQVEILPVERRGGSRARRAARGRPAGRGGSAACRPSTAVSSSIHCGTGSARSSRRRPSRGAARRTRGSGRWLSIAVQKSASRLERRRAAGCAPASSTPPRWRSRRRHRSTSSSPPGASTMSANALTIRSPSGGASAPERPSVSVKRSHSVR